MAGAIVLCEPFELQNTCVIEGEIRARAEHLQLDEGARFNGQIEMIDANAAAPQIGAARQEPAA